MNFLKSKVNIFTLLTLVALVFTITSCNKDKDNTPTPTIDKPSTSTAVVTTIKSEDQSLLEKVLALDEVVNFDEATHGKLVREEAFIAQAISNNEGEEVAKLISIPIENEGEHSLKSLDIIFKYKTQTFEFEVMEINYAKQFIELIEQHPEVTDLTQEEAERLGITYSATHKHMDLDGFTHAKKVYDKNLLVTNFQDNSRGWTSCMFYCIKDKMGKWDYIKCGWNVGKCVITKSLYSCLKAVKSCLGSKYWSSCNSRC